jgi:GAF domain-containing protein/ActR/RegA family two-component response regulator
MSDPKKLNKRLKDLFADLEQEISHLPGDDENLLGWTWECDTQGQYISCSAEVERILGLSADDFLGKPLATFRLAAHSQEEFSVILSNEKLPKEVILEFKKQDNSNIPIRLHFFNTDASNGDSGLRGFTQVIQGDGIAKAGAPPLPPQESTTSFSGLTFPEGIAVENDQYYSVSNPYSSTGEQSLALRQTVVNQPGFDFPAALAVPVELQQQALGLLEFIDENPDREWSEDEQRLVEEVAGQLSLALENARLIQQITERSEELALINRVVSEVASSLDLTESLQIITSEVSKVLNIQVNVALLNPQSNTLTLVSDYLPDQSEPTILGYEIPIAGNLSTEKVFETKRPLIIDDPQTNPLTESIHDLMQSQNCQCLGIFPLLVQNEVFGTVGLYINQEGRTFSQNEIQLVETIIAQAATAIQNARLFEQIQARSTQLQTAAEISRAASSILEPNPLILQAVNLIRDRFELYYAGIFLVDQDGSWTGEADQWAVLRAGTGEAGRIQVEQGHKLEVGGTSMIGQCISQSEARISLQTADETQRFINPYLPDTQSEMALPLISRGRVFGAMTIQSVQSGAFSEEDISVLQTMADQVANALQNANLFDQSQARAEELAILNEMSRVLTNLRETETIIESIYEFTSRLMDTTIFHIALYNEERDELSMPFVIINGKKAQVAPRSLGNGLSDHIIRTQNHLLFNANVIEEMQAIGIEVIHMGEGKDPLSWLGVPLVMGENSIGMISVQSITTPRLYNEGHLNLLTAIASQAVISLQNANLFAQTEVRAEELHILNEMSLLLSSQLEIDEIIQTIYKFTSQLMDTSYFFVCLYNSDEESLSFPLVVENNQISQIESMKKSRGLTQHIIDTKEPLLIYDNVEQTISNLGLEHIVVGKPAQSWLGVPLLMGDQVLGAIATQNADKPRIFNEHHQDLLLSVARQTAIAIQNARLFKQTQEALSETEALLNIASVSSRTLELQSSLNDVLDLVLNASNFDSGLFTIYNPKNGKLELIAQHLPEQLHASMTENGFEGSLCELVFLRKEPIVVSSFKDEALFDGSAFIDLGFEAYQGVPLESRGEILGTLCTFKRTPISKDDASLSLMQAVAQQVGVAIENANLFEQTQQQLSNISTIQATTADLSAALTFDGVVNTLLAHLTSAILADSASVFLLDGNNMIRSGVFPNIGAGASNAGEIISLSDYPLVKKVVETHQPLAISTEDQRLQEHARQSFKNSGVGANATIPIVGTEEVIGTVSVNRNAPAEGFSDDELNLMTTLVNQAAVSMQNARLYEEQRETADQLRELDQLKSQFLANMSHELRTPLNSIIGFSRVIMKGIDGPVTDQQTQDLSAIYNAGQHLLNMINDILDISKIEAGKMELAFEEVDLIQIIESVMSTARGLVKDAPVDLITSISEDIPILNADSTRIRQILLNLISNAAKFTDEGSITVSARTQTNENGQPEIYISVTDTGVGIALEDQVDLFEPFTQVDGSATRKTGGTGLGLSITRLLVDLHQGTIGVDSEVGKGSTFYFTIPFSPRENLIVLVVDGDPQITEIYQRYLDDTNFQVESVSDFSQIIETSRQQNPFAITLDLVLPDHDGWELLQELKNHPDTEHIPVIICSIKDETEKALEMGAVNYLTKPILDEDLIRALNRLQNENSVEGDQN